MLSRSTTRDELGRSSVPRRAHRKPTGRSLSAPGEPEEAYIGPLDRQDKRSGLFAPPPALLFWREDRDRQNAQCVERPVSRLLATVHSPVKRLAKARFLPFSACPATI